MRTTLLSLRPVSTWRDLERPASRDLHGAVVDQIELVFLPAFCRRQFNRANAQRVVRGGGHPGAGHERTQRRTGPVGGQCWIVRRAVDIQQPCHQGNTASGDRAARVLHRQNERGQRYVVGVGPGCGVAGRRIGSGCCGNRSRSATGRDGRLRAEFADSIICTYSHD